MVCVRSLCSCLSSRDFFTHPLNVLPAIFRRLDFAPAGFIDQPSVVFAAFRTRQQRPEIFQHGPELRLCPERELLRRVQKKLPSGRAPFFRVALRRNATEVVLFGPLSQPLFVLGVFPVWFAES